MATADSVKNKIQGLITKANQTTGGSAGDMTEAVDALIAGFGAGGITPTGTKSITENGTHDVTNYAKAEVNVPVGITPSGTKSIATNGTHDVTNYASAQVNVPVGITPSGSLEITENGTYDVTNKASAVVNVPTGGGSDNYHVIPLTLPLCGDASAAKNTTLVSNNAFVKANYNKDGFFVILMPLNAADSVQENKYSTFLYHGNRCIANSKSPVYGIRTNGGGSGSYATGGCHTTKISGSGYTAALRATSAGAVTVYTGAGYYVPAGNYLLILALAE